MSMTVAETALVRPHGGTLVDRIVTGAEAEALRAARRACRAITLDAREQADLELIATGAASPLDGLPGPGRLRERRRATCASPTARCGRCRSRSRSPTTRRPRSRAATAALHDASGRLWGVIEVERRLHARPARGVAQGLRHRGRRAPRRRVPARRGRARSSAGRVQVLPLPEDLPFARLPPDAARAARARSPSAAGAASPASRPATRSTARTSTSPSSRSRVATASSSTRSSARRRATTCPRAVRFAAYEALVETLLPARPHAARRVPGGDALRRPARGALPRARAQELRHQPADRRAATTPASASTTGPTTRSAIFDRFTAEELGVTAAQVRADLLLPRLRRARLVAHLPARRGVAARAVGDEGPRDPARAAATCPRSSRGPRSPRSCARHYSAGAGAAPRAPRAARRDRRLHPLVHRPLGRRQVDARPGAAPRARRERDASRSSTATRSARTSRRASASRRRTATPTSGASASWRGCSRATASVAITRRSRPTPRRATRCARSPSSDGVPFVEVYAERVARERWPRAT